MQMPIILRIKIYIKFPEYLPLPMQLIKTNCVTKMLKKATTYTHIYYGYPLKFSRINRESYFSGIEG